MTERERELRIKHLKEKRRRTWRRMAIALRLLVISIIVLLIAWLLVGVTRGVRMNELKKQDAELAHLEENFEKYNEQNETMAERIREYDEVLKKYEDAPKSELQQRLEQYEDEIVNLGHEIEDHSQEAAEVKKQIAFYKDLLKIDSKEEVTLPEPESEETSTASEDIPAETPAMIEPAVEPSVELPAEPPTEPPAETPVEVIGNEDEFERE